jgi:hypothetical protein
VLDLDGDKGAVLVSTGATGAAESWRKTTLVVLQGEAFPAGSVAVA